MHARLIGAVAIAALAFGGCGTTTTRVPSGRGTPSSPSTHPTGLPSASIGSSASQPIPYVPDPVGHIGGSLIVGEFHEPATIWWNVFDNSSSDVQAFGPALWSLWNSTMNSAWYGQLATNVPTVKNGGVKLTSAGGMDVTIDLVAGAAWSDGQPITCDDLAYDVAWFMDRGQVGNIQHRAGWEDIAGVDGGTGSTCTAHFRKEYENYLGLWSPVLPRHYLQTVSVADAVTELYTQKDPSRAVYSGPYVPVAWKPGVEIDFIPNRQFWSTIKKAPAPFDSVVLKVYGSSADEAAGFKKGEFDVGGGFNQTDLPILEGAGIAPAAIDIADAPTYEQHSYNLASLSAKFGDQPGRALMEALHYAYDKDRVVERIGYGDLATTCNFSFPKAWWYAAIACPTLDYARAAQILNDAGFRKGSDGILVAPNAKKVELLACATRRRQYETDTLSTLSSLLQAHLGIKFNVTIIPNTNPGGFGGGFPMPAGTPCNIRTGDFDLVEFTRFSGTDPAGIYPLCDSKSSPSDGVATDTANIIRVKIPALDAALEDMVASADLDKVAANMKTVQQIYVDPAQAFPEIPLYFWKSVSLENARMHNVFSNGTASTVTWNIEDWWREAT